MDYNLDKEDMKSVLQNFYKQIDEAEQLTKNIKVSKKSKIFILGMGGSALPGDLLKDYLDLDIRINKNYTTKGIDEDSLVFVISYSGNTEETVAMYREAMKTKAEIIAISSGGKIEELAKMNNNTHIKVPSGIQPRQAIGYQFFPLLFTLQNSEYIDKREDIETTKQSLQKDYIEKSIEIAYKVNEKIPLIYSSTEMRIVAEKWKISFNENAKTPAFFNVFPELNHNEMNSFVNIFGEYFIIIIKDEDDNPRIKKRMDVFKALLQEKDIDVMEMVLKGDHKLSKILSSMYLSDWVSYHLALLYGIDPSPVDIVEEFKRRLK